MMLVPFREGKNNETVINKNSEDNILDQQISNILDKKNIGTREKIDLYNKIINKFKLRKEKKNVQGGDINVSKPKKVKLTKISDTSTTQSRYTNIQKPSEILDINRVDFDLLPMEDINSRSIAKSKLAKSETLSSYFGPKNIDKDLNIKDTKDKGSFTRQAHFPTNLNHKVKTRNQKINWEDFK